MSAPVLPKAAYQWLSLPTTLAGILGGALATLYGVLAVRLPSSALGLFWGLAAVAVILANAYAQHRAGRHLEALRELDRGRAPEPGALLAAIREIASLPDLLFVVALQAWVGGATFAGLGLMLLAPEVSWTAALRICLIGVVVGPIEALLGHALSTLRGRKLIRRLAAAGLTAEQVIEVLPPGRRQLRPRLVLFVVICTLTPAFLAADLSGGFARATLLEVVEVQGPEAQREAAVFLQRRAVAKVAGLAGLVILVALFIAHQGGTALSAPLRELADEANRIASGDVGRPRLVLADQEVWEVSTAFTRMHVQLARLLSELRRAGIHVGSTTEQIVATSSRHAGGAADQATALNETSATTEELARSAAQIAENAGQVSTLAEQTLVAAEEGLRGAEAFSDSMARMRQDNRSIAESVTKLSRHVGQIGRMVEFINGVADKSDLLALSAELEGTKAGEVGRGFSLVAGEMRRLAENVLESTKEIEELIEEIRAATQAAVKATGAGVKATDAGDALAGEVSTALREIVQVARQTSEAVRSISLATQQQQTGTDQLADAMIDILRVTEVSLTATRQVTAANTDLSALASELKAAVERFRIAEAGGHG